MSSPYTPLTNPLNLILLIPLVYLVQLLIFPPQPKPTPLPTEYDPDVYNWLPAKHPDVLLHQRYRPSELTRYDGKDGGRILLAIMRVGRDGLVKPGLERTVFDVSAGRGFYGPDGMYGNFAGRDASRGMAKQSFDEDMLAAIESPLDTLEDLTLAEIDNMKGWHEHFERKYIVCGELVEPGTAE